MLSGGGNSRPGPGDSPRHHVFHHLGGDHLRPDDCLIPERDSLAAGSRKQVCGLAIHRDPPGRAGGEGDDGSDSLDRVFVRIFPAPRLLAHSLCRGNGRQLFSYLRAPASERRIPFRFADYAWPDCLTLQPVPAVGRDRKPDRHSRAYSIPAPDHRFFCPALSPAWIATAVPNVVLSASGNYFHCWVDVYFGNIQ